MDERQLRKLWEDEVKDIILEAVLESRLNRNSWQDNGDREYELKRTVPALLKTRSSYTGQIPGQYYSSEVSWDDREVSVLVDFRHGDDMYTVEVVHSLRTKFTNVRQGTLFANHRQPKLV